MAEEKTLHISEGDYTIDELTDLIWKYHFEIVYEKDAEINLLKKEIERLKNK